MGFEKCSRSARSIREVYEKYTLSVKKWGQKASRSIREVYEKYALLPPHTPLEEAPPARGAGHFP